MINRYTRTYQLRKRLINLLDKFIYTKRTKLFAPNSFLQLNVSLHSLVVFIDNLMIA